MGRVLETTVGPVELPIRYTDATAVSAFFAADRAAACRLLEPLRLEAVPLGRRALVTVSFYDYRDSTIGPYREVGLAVLARLPGSRGVPGALQLLLARPTGSSGFAVLDLPVTTERADVAGRELWGYPKFVTPLPFELRGRRFRGAVLAPSGGTICELAGTLGRGVPAVVGTLATYSWHEGRRWRTTLTTSGRTTLASGRHLRFSLGDAAHPMRDHLSALGLDGRRPLVTFTTPAFRAELHPGAPG